MFSGYRDPTQKFLSEKNTNALTSSILNEQNNQYSTR